MSNRRSLSCLSSYRNGGVTTTFPATIPLVALFTAMTLFSRVRKGPAKRRLRKGSRTRRMPFRTKARPNAGVEMPPIRNLPSLRSPAKALHHHSHHSGPVKACSPPALPQLEPVSAVQKRSLCPCHNFQVEILHQLPAVCSFQVLS